MSGRYTRNWTLLEQIAREELAHVGDAALGEWAERGDLAFHLRRRLTAREMADGRIEAVLDVRGSPEHARRVQQMRRFLPPSVQQLPDHAFP